MSGTWSSKRCRGDQSQIGCLARGIPAEEEGSVCLGRIRVAGYDPPAPTETTSLYRAATYGIGGDQSTPAG